MHAQKICWYLAPARLMRCEISRSHRSLRRGREFGILDGLQRGVGDAGLRRIAFVVGGIDRKQRRFNLFQSCRRVVIVRGAAREYFMVGISPGMRPLLPAPLWA